MIEEIWINWGGGEDRQQKRKEGLKILAGQIFKEREGG